MAEIVNLRRVRKNKARAEKDAAAEENRVRFGRSKAERTNSKGNDLLDMARLEGHKLEK